MITNLPDSPVGSMIRSRYWTKRLGLDWQNNAIHVMSGVRFFCIKSLYFSGGGSINIGAVIDPCESVISIGKNILIGPYVVIRAANHKFNNPDEFIIHQGHCGKPIVIEDDVWIGAHAVILPGTIIGKGCVIGAGAVINKSYPPFSIVGGVPGKIIGQRKHPLLAIESVTSIGI